MQLLKPWSRVVYTSDQVSHDGHPMSIIIRRACFDLAKHDATAHGRSYIGSQIGTKWAKAFESADLSSSLVVAQNPMQS
jgi:hypothetical protein